MAYDFQPGDIIDFCGDTYKVIENHGESGKVQEFPGGCFVCPFYWEFQGAKCTLVTRTANKTLEKTQGAGSSF